MATFWRFFWKNLTFTKTTARWVVILSALSLVKSFLFLTFPTAVVYFPFLVIPLRLVLPVYLILYFVLAYRKSPFAAVCFARAGVHLLVFVIWMLVGVMGSLSMAHYYVLASVEPLLSISLIFYVLSHSWESMPSTEETSPVAGTSELSWRKFFLVPTYTFVLLLFILLVTYLYNSGSSSRVIQESLGAVTFAVSILGIVLHLILAIIFAFLGKRSNALGSLFAIFMLVLIGFFGCVTVLSNANFH